MAMFSRNPSMINTYWFRTVYESAFSELPTEHILKNVTVSFENSDHSIPYEVIITEPETERNGVVSRIWTNAANNSLRDIFYGPKTPTNAFEAFRNNYIFNYDTSLTRDEVDDFMAYVDEQLSYNRAEAIIDIVDDMFFVVKPRANVKAKVRVYAPGTFNTSSNHGLSFNGLNASISSLKTGGALAVAAADPDNAFELTDINGAVPDADGYITVDAETILKLNAKKAKALAELGADPEAYRCKKAELASIAGEAIIKTFPELAGKLRLLDCWTPKTYRRYFGSDIGAYMSFAFSSRVLPLPVGCRVPGIENLVLATQWQQPPGGLPIAASAGKRAAERICLLARRESVAGPSSAYKRQLRTAVPGAGALLYTKQAKIAKRIY